MIMSRYLEMVDQPSHLKKLKLDQLTALAAEVREELITKLSKNGGHLGPNLGVVELTIALHSVFSTPKDKFVWDVSHQSYVHKLFTGRKARFQSIRTTGGLNGFSLRTESEHDCYGAGHAGTALSAALGMCAARDQRKSDEHVVCVFGDAALTNGISFEGDLIDLGIAHKILSKSGAWFKYGETYIGQGKEKSRNFLIENKDVAQEIRDAIVAAGGYAGPEGPAGAEEAEEATADS